MTFNKIKLAALVAFVTAGCHGANKGEPGADLAVSAGGGTTSHGNAIPLLSPPVRAATPAGLLSSQMQTHLKRGYAPSSLSPSDIKSRFFTNGPTAIFAILQSVDDRLTAINQTIQAGGAGCLATTPVAYTLPLGSSLTMYAQCADMVGSSGPGDPGFLQLGQNNGMTYLYQAIGQGEVAAIVTPAGGADGGVASDDGGTAADYRVEIWMSVGTLNSAGSAWDSGSYGVIHLRADAATHQFEMAVAGLGFGYCGAQLRSDGTNIYVVGSPDMGTSCAAVDNICVAGSDAMTPATCSAEAMAFALPALGRQHVIGTSQSWAASLYPATPAGGNLLFDGSASDAAHFGPTTPTPGAASLTSGSGNSGGTH